MSTPPPCAGLWELFDSTDPHDHRKARTLCSECPILADCRQRLEMARNDSHKGNPAHQYGPQGTWAGKLIGYPRRSASAQRIAAEDAMFTDDELRAAHAAWAAGVDDDRTRMGERIYQRKKSRDRTKRMKEAA